MSNAQSARLDLADDAVEMIEMDAFAPTYFFPDLAVEFAVVALVEEVGKNRTPVGVVATLKAGIEGALGFAEEVGQVLEVIVDVRIGHFLHPSRG